LRKSLTLAAIISIIHSGSAVILSFLLYFVLTGIKGMMQIRMQGYFMGISGIFIILIGLLFLLLKIFDKDKIDSSNRSAGKNLILIGFSAGIVPCPAALMIMLFTISNNLVTVGLASVISISTGMFFLLTLIGIISIKSRDGIITASGKITKNSEIVSAVIEYVSIILIILIGISMSLNMILNLIKQE
jgi:nickel/cobalt transporter (NicO) family protein